MKRKLYSFSLLFLMSMAGYAAESDRNINAPKVSFSDSLVINPLKKRNIVKLDPNPTTNGSVSLSSRNGEELHFYVFDVEGTLVHQVHLKGKQKHTLSNLGKGVYTYDVFVNDESVEQGKLIVK